MKVLWFANTPGNASARVSSKYKGGGWIGALEEELSKQGDIELAVAFFFVEQPEWKFKLHNTTYYAMPLEKQSMAGRVYNRHRHRIADSHGRDHMLKVVEDFKPDVIQMFGTESIFGTAIPQLAVPAVIHIQSILNTVMENWFPKGISNFQVFFSSPVSDLVGGHGPYHDYYLFRNMATRELEILKHCRYFMGRTSWDSNAVKVYSNGSTYFHCDEMIRTPFWQEAWAGPTNGTVKISTTVNPNFYKGYDTILRTAHFLKNNLKLDFEWNIYGVHSNHPIRTMFEKLVGLNFEKSNVIFRGPVDAEELASILKHTTIFVHPSHIDNSPNSLCEAMLMGVPVVASQVGGIPSLVENGVNGILFPDCDDLGLAVSIADCVRSTSKMESLGKAARETAMQRHNKERIVNSVKSAYQTMLQH